MHATDERCSAQQNVHLLTLHNAAVHSQPA